MIAAIGVHLSALLILATATGAMMMALLVISGIFVNLMLISSLPLTNLTKEGGRKEDNPATLIRSFDGFTIVIICFWAVHGPDFPSPAGKFAAIPFPITISPVSVVGPPEFIGSDLLALLIRNVAGSAVALPLTMLVKFLVSAAADISSSLGALLLVWMRLAALMVVKRSLLMAAMQSGASLIKFAINTSLSDLVASKAYFDCAPTAIMGLYC